MRNVRFTSLMCLTLAALFLGGQAPLARTVAQDRSQAAEGEEPKTEVKTPRKARGRVPTHYGRVGLSDAQKEKIYAVQSEFNDRIAELQKQIQDLEARRNTEVESVLTPGQKKQLEELRAAARKRAAERRLKKKPA